MIFYRNLKEQVDIEFDNYLISLLQTDGNSKRYFYWTLEYFSVIGGLSFQYYPLSDDQKNEINSEGAKYFKSKEVYFEINKNSHRHDLLIKNIVKIFNENVSNQQKRYEYLKEYILWQILIELSAKEKVDKKIVLQQKNNFLITYLIYLIENTNNPTFEPFAKYIKYKRTNRGQELIEKLDDLDKEFVYDPKSDTDIKKKVHNLNPDLRNKVDNLYVLKAEESKIRFVFSRNSGGGKEELRELLDLMGNKEAGNLYRGQANSTWGLDASITREPKYLNNESDMYYDILSLKPDAFQNDRTVYERLITMQHYGMPTRLLDITRNPLVAIFFACNNWECKDVDGTVYTFDPPSVKSDFLNFEDKRLEFLPFLFNHNDSGIKEEAKDFLSEIWFIRGVAKNQRINNQSGDFIFVGKGDDVKQELHNLPKMTIIIDSFTKEVLLQQLESLNIHGGAVYPDLTHMSNYIRNKYSNGDSIEIPIDIKKKPKVTSRKTSKKPTKTDVSIERFDFKTIKDKNREEQIGSFSEFYNMDSGGLSKIVDDYLFTEKEPFRPEVAKVMHDKPSVIREQDKIDAVIQNIITLAKLVSKD